MARKQKRGMTKEQMARIIAMMVRGLPDLTEEQADIILGDVGRFIAIYYEMFQRVLFPQGNNPTDAAGTA